MNNKQMKKATVDAINVMISHADKGPSGFWVEDHEGCGNPAVFPEFEEGLKRGRLIQKEHYFCQWNTAKFLSASKHAWKMAITIALNIYRRC